MSNNHLDPRQTTQLDIMVCKELQMLTQLPCNCLFQNCMPSPRNIPKEENFTYLPKR